MIAFLKSPVRSLLGFKVAIVLMATLSPCIFLWLFIQYPSPFLQWAPSTMRERLEKLVEQVKSE